MGCVSDTEDWARENDPVALELFRVKEQLKEQRRATRNALRRAELERERLDLALAIAPRRKDPVVLKPFAKRTKKRRACAVAIASDWHVEEVVKPEEVSGLNTYNPEVATVRAKRFWQAFVYLVKHQRSIFQIDTLCVALLGDMISGYLREEDMEANAMSPSEAIIFAQDLITPGLQLVLDELKPKRLFVPCTYGNHGRTTQRPRIRTGARNSFEWLMYQSLARHFSKDKRVEFDIAEGALLYSRIYGLDIRWHHGDHVRYSGGIQGLGVPLSKQVARWDAGRKADLTAIGHYHQLGWYGTKAVTNGSLIGFNAYAQSIGASPEPARQAFFLIDSKRGVCQQTPIWVEA